MSLVLTADSFVLSEILAKNCLDLLDFPVRGSVARNYKVKLHEKHLNCKDKKDLHLLFLLEILL